MNTEQIIEQIDSLGSDERAVLELVLEGLVAGRSKYGELKIDCDPRNFVREALEEARDGLIYTAAAQIRAQRERARVSAAVESLAGLVRPLKSPPADTVAESASDDCTGHGCDSIKLGPREPHSLRGQPVSVAPERATAKYGRSQRVPGRRYKERPDGRADPLCDAPGCDNLARSHGLCRRHGG